MEHKRIKVIPKNPNPLFKKWLREWIEDAEKKKRKISKVYKRALDSLNKYPLTLYSGHDCAILESFGPKICQMLDEKLEQHLNGRLDLFQQTCYKDKISEIQRRDAVKVSDLVRSVEAACLTDNTFAATLEIIDEDMEMSEVSFHNDVSFKEDIDQENLSPAGDVEIPEELLSSSAESEDSFDRLLRKYDPEKATQKKFTKKRSKQSENVIKRQKVTNSEQIIDLSISPEASPVIPITYSPVSTIAKGGTRLKKFKTFDSHLAGPSYASSPISRFLDVEITNQSPPISMSKYGDDSFDRLTAKYDCPPVIAAAPTSPAKKLVKKPSIPKLRTVNEILKKVPSKAKLTTTQSIPEEDADDDIKYISIDEITPHDYNVVLLVDTAETSG
jgi:hypothetical protein